MNANPSALQPIEFKGRMLLVSILRLHPADGRMLHEALEARMAEAPELMRDLPVVADLEAMADVAEGDLLSLLGTLRSHGVKLIGLQKGAVSGPLTERAGLPLITVGPRSGGEVPLRSGRADPPPEEEGAPQGEVTSPPPHTPTLLVDQPVRSGQQVYARGGDLVITGAVSAGAELLADGHIHVYGTLRGKALAGVLGLAGARIFCRRLEAELVSIAGHYRIAEDILDAERGENRVVTLCGETIKICEI